MWTTVLQYHHLLYQHPCQSGCILRIKVCLVLTSESCTGCILFRRFVFPFFEQKRARNASDWWRNARCYGKAKKRDFWVRGSCVGLSHYSFDDFFSIRPSPKKKGENSSRVTTETFSSLEASMYRRQAGERGKWKRAGVDGKGKSKPPFPSSHRPPRGFYFSIIAFFIGILSESLCGGKSNLDTHG